MPSKKSLRIGTRGSKLARWQSDWVAQQLRSLGADVEIVEIATQGDLRQGPVATLDIQGVFTKEIQAAVLRGEVDLAVHSLKDLPTLQIDGLVLAATPERESTADVLIAEFETTLQTLPANARIGTGSLRRRAQLLHARPDLAVLDIRGNVDTRLAKLKAGEFDAIVLAYAGLRRLGWHRRNGISFLDDHLLPAPGQGSLGVECRADDLAALSLVKQLDHAPTRLAVTAERVLLGELQGGCTAPIAALGTVVDGSLVLKAMVADVEGREVLRASGSTRLPTDGSGGDAIAAAIRLGQDVARDLASQGAARLIETTRRS